MLLFCHTGTFQAADETVIVIFFANMPFACVSLRERELHETTIAIGSFRKRGKNLAGFLLDEKKKKYNIITTPT